MEHTVTTKKWYVVTGTAGATVTSPDGSKTFCTIPDGGQGTFYATTPKVVTSDDSVEVTEATFNYAPVKLRLLSLLGGGVSNGLPSGYMAAEFLESTGTQYLMTGFFPDDSSEIKIDINPLSAPQDMSIWLFANANLDRTEGGRSLKAAASPQGNLYFEYGSLDSGTAFGANPLGPSFGERRIIELKNEHYDTGLKKGDFSKQSFSTNLVELSIFRNIRDTTLSVLDIYSCTLAKNGKTERDFVPMLDASGVPCMFDKVSGESFYNAGSGAFIVGMTIEQARKLGKLPATGGTLTVSLPSNYLEDEGVVNALATAQENGWKITIQTYEAETGAASTFALRRVWVRKRADEQGSYVDTDGFRWQVEWCVDIVGADPEQEGYEPFRSVEAAVAYWGLMPWVDPEQEELLTNTEEQ